MFARPTEYAELPRLTDYVIGVDLGFDDSDAICVLGWSGKEPKLYLVHEDVLPKQLISELAAKLEALVKTYSPLGIVMDTGGLGKKIAEEIRKRTALPVEAADKVRKFEHIELLNDAIRTGLFVAPKGSRFGSDALKVEWDKTIPERPKIKAGFHSDIADSVLYAYRKALHWLHEPTRERPRPGTAEAQALDAEEMEALQERLWREQNEDPWAT